MRYAEKRLAGVDETGERGAEPKQTTATNKRILALLDQTPPEGMRAGQGQHIDAFIKAYKTTAAPFAWTKSEVHQKRLKPRSGINRHCVRRLPERRSGRWRALPQRSHSRLHRRTWPVSFERHDDSDQRRRCGAQPCGGGRRGVWGWRGRPRGMCFTQSSVPTMTKWIS